ncbi:hypothetical protein ABTX81_28435 [Kitasatospora sp. NPDC097605]|uniref:hypothetical protein n=1 Tax=Kitasatospora sp. NPDC097605 TaxID=3157226 RepID=UPI003323E54F
MSQPPQYPYGEPNPYQQQPPVPQQPPAYGAPPPFPGQPYPGQPYPGQPYPVNPAPYAPPRTGSPVGAFFLGLVASVVVAAIYSAILVFMFGDHPSRDTVHTLYLAHAFVNGAVVGLLVGLVGRRSPGAWIAGAVVAALGAFFGYADAVPFVILRESGADGLQFMLEHEPFTPAKAWWGAWDGTQWISVLGLAVAALAAWGIAFLTGRNRR